MADILAAYGRVGNVPRRLKSLAGRRRSWITILILAIVAGFVAVTARLFVWPSSGMPGRVDAIVVIGGLGDRVDYGTKLAREDKASYLVLSRGLGWLPPGMCTGQVGSAKVICFRPDPHTTQGEAEATARLAKRHGWRSIALVTTRDQAWRARLWFGRCFTGQIYSALSPLPWYRVPPAIPYEWGATIKAKLLTRSC